MYLPALALFLTFVIYPLTQGIKWSFTDWTGYLPNYNWVGLKQYARMFSDPRTPKIVGNTLLYGIGSTLFQFILGLAYALFLYQRPRIRGFVQTVVYFPIIISPLILGYIFYFIFQYDGGALNDIVMLFGRKPVDWLGSPGLARWLITAVNTYQYTGISMVVFLAGLQSIPKEYLEAASIDGASGIPRFRNVTLPLLMPAITVNVVLNLVYGLKLFDVIMALTAGGPAYASHSMSTIMYDQYFAQQNAGLAAALGNLMFLMIIVISISTLIFLRRREVEL